MIERFTNIEGHYPGSSVKFCRLNPTPCDLLSSGNTSCPPCRPAGSIVQGFLYDSRLDDNGYVIESDRAEAIKWLLAAAEQGLPRAQSRLAELYAAGSNASGNY